jgi:hypothetical protein
LAEEGKKDWQYAWLSVAAYDKTPAAQIRREAKAKELGRAAQDEWKAPETILLELGWAPWEGFPDKDL